MPQIEEKSEEKEVKVVTTLFTTEIQFKCPHCNAIQDGWVADPSGGTHECEECGNSYRVHPEADIEYGYAY